MRLKWKLGWMLALLLCSAQVAALGLGQIQVRSQHGEPFLAEIPIVSSDPTELRQLQARLASPATFARIGLQPPQGVVSDLQFNVALDAQGRPVIRVTSVAPVDAPLLTFLLEADWGQGRLVREYSALLHAPDTVAAPAQPPIQMAQPTPPAATGTIVRPAQVPAAADVAQPAADEPAPQAVAAVSGPEPAPAPAPAPAQAAPGQYGPVQAGDTLSQIAQRLAPDDAVSLNQMMVALLRANPEAFIGGNLNLLREGAVLRVPARDDAAQLSAVEATAEVRAHVARWRELSAPAALAQAPEAAAGEAAQSQASQQPDSRQARLEIAPSATAEAQQAGTRSGITAGGEGAMLRQELQQTQESLAARDAEVEELKARLGDVERLLAQQQQLITLKDSELAAAQQRLGDVNQQAAPGVGATAADGAAGGAWPWLGAGGLLVLVAIIVALLSRRRAQAARAPAGTAVVAPAASSSAAAMAAGMPTWHGGGQPPAADAAVGSRVPGNHDVAAPAPDAPAAVPLSPAQVEAGQVAATDAEAGAAPGDDLAERLELARAYVSLGDQDTARMLLEDVIARGDDTARDQAQALLRSLT